MAPSPDIEDAYRRYYPAIRAKCGRMLGDAAEAEDVAQETFMRLWDGRQHLREPNAVSTWLYRTSTRLALERLRRAPRWLGDDAEAVQTDPPEPQMLARDVLRAVAAVVPGDELEVAVLCWVDGLTHDEATEVVGKSPRSIRRILARVEERLQRLKARRLAE